MPVTPFGMQPSGGGDAVQGAALQGLKDRGAMGGVPTDQVQNPVAQHVVAIIDILMKTGPTPENLAAIQQLGDFIQQLAQGAQGGQGPMQAQAPPGQAPMGAPMGAPAGPPLG